MVMVGAPKRPELDGSVSENPPPRVNSSEGGMASLASHGTVRPGWAGEPRSYATCSGAIQPEMSKLHFGNWQHIALRVEMGDVVDCGE